MASMSGIAIFGASWSGYDRLVAVPQRLNRIGLEIVAVRTLPDLGAFGSTCGSLVHNPLTHGVPQFVHI